jgi:hypothetical protein
VLGGSWALVLGLSPIAGGAWVHNAETEVAWHLMRGFVLGAVTVYLLRRTPRFLLTKSGAIIVAGYAAAEAASAWMFLPAMRMFFSIWTIGVLLFVAGIIGSGVMFWQLSKITTPADATESAD